MKNKAILKLFAMTALTALTHKSSMAQGTAAHTNAAGLAAIKTNMMSATTFPNGENISFEVDGNQERSKGAPIEYSKIQNDSAISLDTSGMHKAFGKGLKEVRAVKGTRGNNLALIFTNDTLENGVTKESVHVFLYGPDNKPVRGIAQRDVYKKDNVEMMNIDICESSINGPGMNTHQAHFKIRASDDEFYEAQYVEHDQAADEVLGHLRNSDLESAQTVLYVAMGNEGYKHAVKDYGHRNEYMVLLESNSKLKPKTEIIQHNGNNSMYTTTSMVPNKPGSP